MRKLLFLLLSACCLSVLSAPIRSNLGGEGVEGIPEQDAPTAADYIQDGLIAMWDGIENVGYGVHDDTSTVWVDLAGVFNMDMPTRDHVWEEDCIRCDSTKPMYAERTQEFFDCTKEEYTVEAVIQLPDFEYLSPAVNWAILGWGGEAGSQLFSTRIDNSRRWLFSTWRNNYGGVGVSRVQGSTYTVANPVWYAEKIHLSLTGDVDGQRTIRYINGVSEDSWPDAAVPGLSNQYYTWFAINGNGRNNDTWGAGVGRGTRYFSVRIYSRVLTAEEVKYNHHIDVERFGL